MAELGGEAAASRAAEVEAQLLEARQLLLDAEAAALEKDKHVAELERRAAFLERHARIPTTADKCVQTDGGCVAHAGQQAPSLQPSGVPMLEARALAPEGAVGGSVYKRRQLQDVAVGAVGASQPVDASYTLPPPTQLPPHRWGASASAAAGSAPPMPLGLTGSDMQLTGSGQVVEGRLAHAAAVPGVRLGSLTAESVLPAAAVGARPAAAQLAPVPEDAPAVVPAAGERRASLAPVEKQLHFVSTSTQAAVVEPAGAAAAEARAPASSARPASSGPFAPRELALTALTGLVATPMKAGFYRFTEPNSGFVFEFGPAPPESAGAGVVGRTLAARPRLLHLLLLPAAQRAPALVLAPTPHAHCLPPRRP